VLAVSTTGGTVNTLPLFASTSDIEKSVVSQTGSGATAKIGINATPATTLDVNGDTTVRGNLTSNGFVNASTYEMGGSLFAFGSIANENAFLGFAGNTASTNYGNTATGYQALYKNTFGFDNTAYGLSALYANTSGNYNTAVGGGALAGNSTGTNNTAVGFQTLLNNEGGDSTGVGFAALYSNAGNFNTGIGEYSLYFNSTGNLNTGIGYYAGPNQSFMNLSNTTAIGANAAVTASNSLVLGSINGVNNATADTNVGIGITAPTARLQIGVSNTTTGLRVEGPSNAGTGVLAASFGGRGDFGIDAFGVVSGRFVVKENGNVGIGTSTPDSRLSVAGSADKTAEDPGALFRIAA
jgi:hypothetical protein